MATATVFPGVVGDGRHDDTAGLQALLDSGLAEVRLPTPAVAYLISQPLRIHSAQALRLERYATIRLADHAHCYMLINADQARGNHRITVTGGIWDGNNAHQTCSYHQPGGTWRIPFDPARYLGVLMQFNRVQDLRVAHLTYKDPECFAFQGGNLERFTVEDITFDFNMLRHNMDGIHVHGPSRHGRIVNLKGTTNDDLVALNADDGEMFEISRGPITDIVVDGIWADDGWTAVRLLSAGSSIQRIRLANIFGSYRYNVVSLTNHGVHPGTPTRFEDITIQGVHTAKSTKGMPPHPGGPVPAYLSQLWIPPPAVVTNLTIRDYHRTEAGLPADDLHIEVGSSVENLVISECSVTNTSGTPIPFLHNHGTIAQLALSNVRVTADAASAGGQVVLNRGTIGHCDQFGVSTRGADIGL